MTHKHFGFALLVAAALMEYATQQINSGTAQPSDTLWAIEAPLSTVNQLGGGGFHLSYALGAIGIYLLVKA